MGDGPGYDHAAQLGEQRWQETLRCWRQRADHLHAMRCDVGFGERDHGQNAVEAEVTKHLQLAHELLSLLIRSRE